METNFSKSHEEMQLEDFCHALNRENNIIQDQLTEYKVKHEVACSTINLLQKKCDVRGKALSLQCKETKELRQQLATMTTERDMWARAFKNGGTETMQKQVALLRDAAKEQVAKDKLISYERCPDCDYESKCSREAGCLGIKDHSPIASKALAATEPKL